MDSLVARAVDIQACRACLATNAKLYAIHSNNLTEIFTDLTTIPVFQTDGLPQYICNMCYVLLRKSAAFKAKCINTNAFLRNTCFNKYPITTEYISSLDTSHFKIPMTMSKILVLSVPEDSAANNNYNDIEKLKTNIKDEQKPKMDEKESKSHIFGDLKYKVEVDIQYENIQSDGEKLETNKNDSTNDEEVIIIEDDDCIDLEIDRKIAKKNSRIRKLKSENSLCAKNDTNVDYDEKLKKYLLHCKSRSKNSNILLFYEYILSKYLYKTREIHLQPEMDVDTWDAENVDLDTHDNQLPTDTDSTKDKFYDYIRQKYVTRNKQFTPNCQFDINKLKVNLRVIDEANTEKEITDKRLGKSEKEWDDFAKSYNFEIITLSKEEQIKELQAKKESVRYKTSKYKCENCCLGFATESVYKNHMAVHDPVSNALIHLRLNKSGKIVYEHHQQAYYGSQNNGLIDGMNFDKTSVSKEHRASRKLMVPTF